MTLLARVSPAKRQRVVSRVFQRKKTRREFNVSDAVFLSFSDCESQLSVGSIV